MNALFQHTLRDSIRLGGIGLHSGRQARVVLRPAPENTGYVFVRKDIGTPGEIPALFDMVSDTLLNTTVGSAGVTVGTIEHLIAALRGMDLDNVIIEVDGGEVPIMDGSAAPFSYMIKKTGVQPQKRLRKYILVRNEVLFHDGDKFIRIAPCERFSIDFTIEFPHPAVGVQRFLFDGAPDVFEREVARARTFGFLKEVEYLKNRGLALGGSLDNAIVVNEQGIMNEGGLRYPDEFVRHKVLDLIGDIALLGYPIIGKIEAFKSGHALNNQLCRELFMNRRDFSVVEFSSPFTAPGAFPVQ